MKEGQISSSEQQGAHVRNLGIVIGILGLFAAWETVALGGGVLAATGEIYRRAKKTK